MAAIAYITDGKLLELHRLNAHRTMNFWRLSTKTTFSDFQTGDLVFFLSKDRQHQIGNEKGIVGFGKLLNIECASINWLWKKYEKENGYNSLEEFREAIIRVNKDHELPSKISSFYLKNVVFFQTPLYLSEFGINISNNIESYFYIKPEEKVIDILEKGIKTIDLWSNRDHLDVLVDNEIINQALKIAFKEIGDYPLSEKQLKEAHKRMREFQDINSEYRFIGHSLLDLAYVNQRDVTIVLYNDDNLDQRFILGQALLYKLKLEKLYRHPYRLRFKTLDGNEEIERLINTIEVQDYE